MAAVDRVCLGDILKLRAWTPLPSTGIRTQDLSENLKKVCERTYLLVVDADAEGQLEGGPFVTTAVWAESDGAALRVVDGNLEADSGRDSDIAPDPTLLPAGASHHYGSILAALRRSDGKVLEAAEYRIAKDGAFLHKVIRGRRHAYFFRGRDVTPTEKPFAILYRLP